MPYLQYFPEAFIQLNMEIQNHPVLMEMLVKHADTDAELQFSKMLAEIAAYCNVALDGDYDEKLMIKIVDICITRLKYKRMAVLATPQKEVVDRSTPVIVDEFNNPIVKH